MGDNARGAGRWVCCSLYIVIFRFYSEYYARRRPFCSNLATLHFYDDHDYIVYIVFFNGGCF